MVHRDLIHMSLRWWKPNVACVNECLLSLTCMYSDTIRQVVCKSCAPVKIYEIFSYIYILLFVINGVAIVLLKLCSPRHFSYISISSVIETRMVLKFFIRLMLQLITSWSTNTLIQKILIENYWHENNIVSNHRKKKRKNNGQQTFVSNLFFLSNLPVSPLVLQNTIRKTMTLQIWNQKNSIKMTYQL